MEIKLVATTGRARGQSVEIRAAKFFIGRHDNCQLRPDIDGLAGIHALIEGRENRLYLRDFGVEGGTGINDRVLHARETEVFDGDLIQIGPMVLNLAMKPRGEGTRAGLLHAPEGWPFFEGEVGPAIPPTSSMEPVAVAHRASPSPEPHLATIRAEPFLSIHPSIRAESVADAGSSHAAAVVAGPRPAPSPSKPPIDVVPARPLGRRAIDCRMVDGVMVVSLLSPDLNEEETVSPFRYELRTLLDDEKVPGRMVIDMGNTRYLSSRAVGVLLAHYQGLERVGSTMRVCGVSKEIKPVLDQMRLSMLIDIYPTVDDAIRDSWD